MATILYAWELGGGLGHVLPFIPLAQRLRQNSHRVVAALRQLQLQPPTLVELGLEIIPAPHKNWRTEDRIEPACTFAHILHNTGWSNPHDLNKLVSDWRKLIATVRPDLIIADHSPCALLAARIEGVPCVTFGTGFFLPLDQTPLPNLRLSPEIDLDQQAADEDRVLRNANAILQSAGLPKLSRLTQLYADVPDKILTTFAELDHFPNRNSGRYCGVWRTAGVGRRFAWPAGLRPRVFAYLKDAPGTLDVVRFLAASGHATMLFAPQLADRVKPPINATLGFSATPLEMEQVRSECDFAVLNANHATAAEILLAGKPILSVPITLEQGLLARRIAAQGLGLAVPLGNPQHFAAAYRQMTTDPRYTQAAQRFAQKYAAYDSQKAIEDVITRLEALLP